MEGSQLGCLTVKIARIKKLIQHNILEYNFSNVNYITVKDLYFDIKLHLLNFPNGEKAIGPKMPK